MKNINNILFFLDINNTKPDIKYIIKYKYKTIIIAILMNVSIPSSKDKL